MTPRPSPGSAVVRRFTALPAAWRGSLWMLFAVVAISLMGVLAKLAGARLHSFQITFVRALFGLLVIAPFIVGTGFAAMRTRRLPLHLGRGVAGTSAMISSFFAVTHLPLADAVALTFTKPLFVVLLAALVLRETVRWRRWSATAVGFVGVLVMVQPGAATVEPAVFVALWGAASVAASLIFIKAMSPTESPVVILAYFAVISTVLTLAGALFVWQTPTPRELLMLLAMGVVGSFGQLATIRALRIVDASAIAPLDYLRLPIAGGLAFFIFLEVPTLATIGGALIIIASSLYIARREAALDKPVTPPSSSVV